MARLGERWVKRPRQWGDEGGDRVVFLVVVVVWVDNTIRCWRTVGIGFFLWTRGIWTLILCPKRYIFIDYILSL